MDQIGVGVWPKCSNSYYWAVDVGDTIWGPQAITQNPIYDGAHMMNVTPGQDAILTFIVSGWRLLLQLSCGYLTLLTFIKCVCLTRH